MRSFHISEEGKMQLNRKEAFKWICTGMYSVMLPTAIHGTDPSTGGNVVTNK